MPTFSLRYVKRAKGSLDHNTKNVNRIPRDFHKQIQYRTLLGVSRVVRC